MCAVNSVIFAYSMNKHKKTKLEKIRADFHRKMQLQRNANYIQPTITMQPMATLSHTTLEVKTLSPYLRHDLLKTLFLTSAIITAELLLLFTLKKHMIVGF